MISCGLTEGGQSLTTGLRQLLLASKSPHLPRDFDRPKQAILERRFDLRYCSNQVAGANAREPARLVPSTIAGILVPERQAFRYFNPVLAQGLIRDYSHLGLPQIKSEVDLHQRQSTPFNQAYRAP